MKEFFTFDDVLLVPRRSRVFSRKDVSLRSNFSRNIVLDLPIVSANMDTVTESKMAIAMAEAGGLGVIHRFLTIEKQAEEISKVKKQNLLVGAAIGVKDSIERAKAVIDAGADVLVVDIAHGHNERALETIKTLKKKFKKIDVAGGNVATREGVLDLIRAGADAVKIGIGPGAACTTRIVTGVGVPQLSAIIEAVKAAKKFNIPIVADGGIKNSGDMCKALAAGAGSVMVGSLFAGAEESPGEHIMEGGTGFKPYRGMASSGVLILNDGFYRTPEGKAGRVPYAGEVRDILKDLSSGLRSSMSYLGATNLNEYKKNAEFIKVSHSTLKESNTRF